MTKRKTNDIKNFMVVIYRTAHKQIDLKNSLTI